MVETSYQERIKFGDIVYIELQDSNETTNFLSCDNVTFQSKAPIQVINHNSNNYLNYEDHLFIIFPALSEKYFVNKAFLDNNLKSLEEKLIKNDLDLEERNKLLKLLNETKNEVYLQNQFITESIGQSIKYSQKIIFVHMKSEMYLCMQETNNNNSKVHFIDQLNEDCLFLFWPYNKYDLITDEIFTNQNLLIRKNSKNVWASNPFLTYTEVVKNDSPNKISIKNNDTKEEEEDNKDEENNNDNDFYSTRKSNKNITEKIKIQDSNNIKNENKELAESSKLIFFENIKDNNIEKNIPEKNNKLTIPEKKILKNTQKGALGYAKNISNNPTPKLNDTNNFTLFSHDLVRLESELMNSPIVFKPKQKKFSRVINYKNNSKFNEFNKEENNEAKRIDTPDFYDNSNYEYLELFLNITEDTSQAKPFKIKINSDYIDSSNQNLSFRNTISLSFINSQFSLVNISSINHQFATSKRNQQLSTRSETKIRDTIKHKKTHLLANKTTNIRLKSQTNLNNLNKQRTNLKAIHRQNTSNSMFKLRLNNLYNINQDFFNLNDEFYSNLVVFSKLSSNKKLGNFNLLSLFKPEPLDLQSRLNGILKVKISPYLEYNKIITLKHVISGFYLSFKEEKYSDLTAVKRIIGVGEKKTYGILGLKALPDETCHWALMESYIILDRDKYEKNKIMGLDQEKKLNSNVRKRIVKKQDIVRLFHVKSRKFVSEEDVIDLQNFSHKQRNKEIEKKNTELNNEYELGNDHIKKDINHKRGQTIALLNKMKKDLPENISKFCLTLNMKPYDNDLIKITTISENLSWEVNLVIHFSENYLTLVDDCVDSDISQYVNILREQQINIEETQSREKRKEDNDNYKGSNNALKLLKMDIVHKVQDINYKVILSKINKIKKKWTVLKLCFQELKDYCLNQFNKRFDSAVPLGKPVTYRQEMLKEQGLLEITFDFLNLIKSVNLLHSEFNLLYDKFKKSNNSILKKSEYNYLNKNKNDKHNKKGVDDKNLMMMEFRNNNTRKSEQNDLEKFNNILSESNSKQNTIKEIFETTYVLFSEISSCISKSFEFIESMCKGNSDSQNFVFNNRKVFDDYLLKYKEAAKCIIDIIKDDENFMTEIIHENINKQFNYYKNQNVAKENNLVDEFNKKSPIFEKANYNDINKSPNKANNKYTSNTINNIKIKRELGLKRNNLIDSIIIYLSENINKYDRYSLGLLSKLMKSKNKGVTSNQEYIFKILLVEDKNNFLLNIQPKFNDTMFYVIYSNELGHSECKSLIEFSSNTSKLTEYEFSILKFLASQLNLYADMCYGRNYVCIEKIRELFPLDHLIHHIANIDIDQEVLGGLINILNYCYIDILPHNKRTYPEMIKIISPNLTIMKSKVIKNKCLIPQDRLNLILCISLFILYNIQYDKIIVNQYNIDLLFNILSFQLYEKTEFDRNLYEEVFIKGQLKSVNSNLHLKEEVKKVIHNNDPVNKKLLLRSDSYNFNNKIRKQSDIFDLKNVNITIYNTTNQNNKINNNQNYLTNNVETDKYLTTKNNDQAGLLTHNGNYIKRNFNEIDENKSRKSNEVDMLSMDNLIEFYPKEQSFYEMIGHKFLEPNLDSHKGTEFLVSIIRFINSFLLGKVALENAHNDLHNMHILAQTFKPFSKQDLVSMGNINYLLMIISRVKSSYNSRDESKSINKKNDINDENIYYNKNTNINQSKNVFQVDLYLPIIKQFFKVIDYILNIKINENLDKIINYLLSKSYGIIMENKNNSFIPNANKNNSEISAYEETLESGNYKSDHDNKVSSINNTVENITSQSVLESYQFSSNFHYCLSKLLSTNDLEEFVLEDEVNLNEIIPSSTNEFSFNLFNVTGLKTLTEIIRRTIENNIDVKLNKSLIKLLVKLKSQRKETLGAIKNIQIISGEKSINRYKICVSLIMDLQISSEKTELWLKPSISKLELDELIRSKTRLNYSDNSNNSRYGSFQNEDNCDNNSVKDDNINNPNLNCNITLQHDNISENTEYNNKIKLLQNKKSIMKTKTQQFYREKTYLEDVNNSNYDKLKRKYDKLNLEENKLNNNSNGFKDAETKIDKILKLFLEDVSNAKSFKHASSEMRTYQTICVSMNLHKTIFYYINEICHIYPINLSKSSLESETEIPGGLKSLIDFKERLNSLIKRLFSLLTCIVHENIDFQDIIYQDLLALHYNSYLFNLGYIDLLCDIIKVNNRVAIENYELLITILKQECSTRSFSQLFTRLREFENNLVLETKPTMIIEEEIKETFDDANVLKAINTMKIEPIKSGNNINDNNGSQSVSKSEEMTENANYTDMSINKVISYQNTYSDTSNLSYLNQFNSQIMIKANENIAPQMTLKSHETSSTQNKNANISYANIYSNPFEGNYINQYLHYDDNYKKFSKHFMNINVGLTAYQKIPNQKQISESVIDDNLLEPYVDNEEDENSHYLNSHNNNNNQYNKNNDCGVSSINNLTIDNKKISSSNLEYKSNNVLNSFHTPSSNKNFQIDNKFKLPSNSISKEQLEKDLSRMHKVFKLIISFFQKFKDENFILIMSKLFENVFKNFTETDFRILPVTVNDPIKKIEYEKTIISKLKLFKQFIKFCCKLYSINPKIKSQVTLYLNRNILENSLINMEYKWQIGSIDNPEFNNYNQNDDNIIFRVEHNKISLLILFFKLKKHCLDLILTTYTSKQLKETFLIKHLLMCVKKDLNLYLKFRKLLVNENTIVVKIKKNKRKKTEKDSSNNEKVLFENLNVKGCLKEVNAAAFIYFYTSCFDLIDYISEKVVVENFKNYNIFLKTCHNLGFIIDSFKKLFHRIIETKEIYNIEKYSEKTLFHYIVKNFHKITELFGYFDLIINKDILKSETTEVLYRINKRNITFGLEEIKECHNAGTLAVLGVDDESSEEEDSVILQENIRIKLNKKSKSNEINLTEIRRNNTNDDMIEEDILNQQNQIYNSDNNTSKLNNNIKFEKGKSKIQLSSIKHSEMSDSKEQNENYNSKSSKNYNNNENIDSIIESNNIQIIDNNEERESNYNLSSKREINKNNVYAKNPKENTIQHIKIQEPAIIRLEKYIFKSIIDLSQDFISDFINLPFASKYESSEIEIFAKSLKSQVNFQYIISSFFKNNKSITNDNFIYPVHFFFILINFIQNNYTKPKYYNEIIFLINLCTNFIESKPEYMIKPTNSTELNFYFKERLKDLNELCFRVIQNQFLENNSVETYLQIVLENVRGFNQVVLPSILNFFIIVMENNNTLAQEKIWDHCCFLDSEIMFYFFKMLFEYDIYIYLRNDSKVISVKESNDNLKFILSVLKFFKNFTEGHNSKTQSYMRYQINNRLSYNFIVLLVEYLTMLLSKLSFIIEKSEEDTTYDFIKMYYERFIQVLETLCEFIQGPCKENQETMMGSKVFEIVDKVLRETQFSGLDSSTTSNNNAEITKEILDDEEENYEEDNKKFTPKLSYKNLTFKDINALSNIEEDEANDYYNENSSKRITRFKESRLDNRLNNGFSDSPTQKRMKSSILAFHNTSKSRNVRSLLVKQTTKYSNFVMLSQYTKEKKIKQKALKNQKLFTKLNDYEKSMLIFKITLVLNSLIEGRRFKSDVIKKLIRDFDFMLFYDKISEIYKKIKSIYSNNPIEFFLYEPELAHPNKIIVETGFSLYSFLATINTFQNKESEYSRFFNELITDNPNVKSTFQDNEKLKAGLKLLKRSIRYFSKNSPSIEVIREGKIEKIFFPKLTYFDLLTDKMIIEFRETANRTSHQTKINSIFMQKDSLYYQLKQLDKVEEWFSKLGIFSFFFNNPKFFQYLAFILSIIMNVFILFGYNVENVTYTTENEYQDLRLKNINLFFTLSKNCKF